MKEVKVFNQVIENEYACYNGDSAEILKGLPDESIHYSIFSPPFASLYVYSASNRDMGNCRTRSEFYDHFEYLVREIHRVLKSGRLVSFHCMNLQTSKQNDGFIGRGCLDRLSTKEICRQLEAGGGLPGPGGGQVAARSGTCAGRLWGDRSSHRPETPPAGWTGQGAQSGQTGVGCNPGHGRAQAQYPDNQL